MKIRVNKMLLTVFCLGMSQTVLAEELELLVDHAPYRVGAFLSDGDFISTIHGQPTSQFSADSFNLTQSSAVRRIVWWGSDYYDNPPQSATFRFRFYADNDSAASPGEMLYEHIEADVFGTATGYSIGTNVEPDEYWFQVDLPAPFWGGAGTTYWIEIAQLGDRAHAFAWDYSLPAVINGLSIRASDSGAWLAIPSGPDLAFQLWSVPEPATFGMVAFGALVARRRLRRGRRV